MLHQHPFHTNGHPISAIYAPFGVFDCAGVVPRGAKETIAHFISGDEQYGRVSWRVSASNKR